MARKGRIDFPGALHHVMARGIERREIFRDDRERQEFLKLLREALERTGTRCFAWALMPNHFHLLLETGEEPVQRAMHMLLFRYAAGINRQNRRVGHLFQGRYKSVLCERDAYFKELVRYIHLNPLRAGLVQGMSGLARYPWCGHGAVLGIREAEWLDRSAVLEMFGRTAGEARAAYERFVADGTRMGKRPDLTGTVPRGARGAWAVDRTGRSGVKPGREDHGDTRILGSEGFARQALVRSGKSRAKRSEASRADWTESAVIRAAARREGVEPEDVRAGVRRRAVTRARALAAWWLVRELGSSGAAAARSLGVSQPAISQLLARKKAPHRSLPRR